MTIKFVGHACFFFVDSKGNRIVIDPYETGAFGGAISYGPITEEADIVLVTHEHADHNYVRGVPGTPTVCREACAERGISFRTVQVDHDEDEGRKRGHVNAFVFELDGVSLCHLGDIGSPLTAAQVAQIGKVDVLMVPVGGTYTLDAEGAWSVIGQLRPSVVIPMHYKTARTSLPLAPLDRFINGREDVQRPGLSVLEVSPEDLGSRSGVIVLDPAN
jgi:L-ascorbate metabolism protein UlaG (beta-lactamase superfamily)